jgi:hypothetical protein
LRDLGFIDQRDLVYIFADDLSGLLADAAHGDAIGNGLAAGQRRRRAALQRVLHARKASRLDPQHSHAGVGFLDCAGDASDQPATSDRYDDRLQIRGVLEELETDRALTGHYPGIVEGVHIE